MSPLPSRSIAWCAAVVLAASGARAADRVVAVPLPDGSVQRALYETPPRPRAVLVMLPGGTGRLDLARDGDMRHDENFVVRSRDLWLAKGYAVLMPDAVDHLNLRGLRSSPAYGDLVDRLVATAAGLAHRPVVLFGTSQGTIAATNGAALLGGMRGSPLTALVLSETVSRPGRKSAETVFDADPIAVRVPVLVVANRADQCDVAPPDAAPAVAAAFRRAKSVKVLDVDGGRSADDSPCGSLSPHGYLGIEPIVVDGIDHWLTAVLPVGGGSDATGSR